MRVVQGLPYGCWIRGRTFYHARHYRQGSENSHPEPVDLATVWLLLAYGYSMAVPRIYTSQPLGPGRRIDIEGQGAAHVTQVLRLRPGAAVHVFDGAGQEFSALLLEGRRARITLELLEPLTGAAEATLDITLAQGIARHDRMDLILQKSVELGVNTIQPLWMQRSQSHLSGARLERRLHHWHGVVISGCEQCGRNTLPALREPLAFRDWIARSPAYTLQLMLQPGEPHSLASLQPPAGNILLLTGPEGGLTSEEQEIARAAGFAGIRLGQRILRTETAALAAIAGMHALWGDFR